MKKIFLFFATISLLATSAAYGQVAKKPSLMVVPSRIWCNENGFMTEYDNMGSVERIPDYRRAFDENSELNLVVAKIGQMMADRGFQLKLMSNALSSLQAEAAEEMVLASKESGAGVAESPVDKLRKIAKADIWLEVYWQVNSMGFTKSITFNLSGIDAYTDKQIANCQGTGQPSHASEIPVLLEEAVTVNLDNFNEQLMTAFTDWFDNGREITVRIKRFDDAEFDLETEFGGSELGMIIEDYMASNTVKSQFSTDDATENMMVFSNVRIPMINESGVAMDARRWARSLQKMLRDKYQITSKIMTKGLGNATIIVGGK